MDAARAIDDYVANPIGRYYAGPTFLHFFADATLCGTIFWARPDAAAIESLTRVLEVELPARSGVHAAFVDATRLTGIDPAAFQALAGYVGPRAHEFGSNVSLQAMVRPSGVIGAMVAGFYDVTPTASPERTRVFVDAGAALAWLGRADGGSLLAELDEARSAASGIAPIVRALHAWVAAHPRGVTTAAAARALGVAPAALRTELRRAGTSFRREVNGARVLAAQALLADSDTKLSAVALEVGCASPQNFSTLFRKQTGLSPSEWRLRHRR